MLETVCGIEADDIIKLVRDLAHRRLNATKSICLRVRGPDFAARLRDDRARVVQVTLKWLGVVPWIALLVGMPFANHVEPFVLGLPLPLFWAVTCTLLSAVVLAIVYVVDPANRTKDRLP